MKLIKRSGVVTTGFASLFLAFAFSSCNEAFDRVLKDEYGESGTDYQTGKVLLIVLDGASGKAVQEAVNTDNAPRIEELTANAMYTYEGLADSRANLSSFSNERGWANLLTGITSHGIGSESNDLEDLQAPSFLTYLESSERELTTALLSSDPDFVAAFGTGADEKEALGNDAAVTQRTTDILSDSEGDPADVMVVHLQGVNKEGQATGFYDESGRPLAPVISAIQAADGQIGEMVDAVKARPNFTKENWLVIVTSNYGGTFTAAEEEEGATFFDDIQRNTFTLLYSPRLRSSLFQPPASDAIRYNYFSPWYSGSGATESAVVKDASLFNMGSRATDTRSYTIQFMIYDTWPNAGNGHSILAKRDRMNNGPGWNIRMNASGGNVAVWHQSNSGGGGENWYQIRKGNPWRVYTYVYKESGDTDYLICYLDGVEFRRVTLNNNEMTNDAPLTIGKIEGATTGNQGHFYVNNVQFYDVALPPEYLAANYCKTRLDEIDGFEYWDNLIGYWPNDREEDFGGDILPDYSQYGSVYGGPNAGRSDMLLTDPIWETGSVLDPNVCPDPDASFYRAVFNTVDIPYQIFQWLGVNIRPEWKQEGMGWPLTYRVLEN